MARPLPSPPIRGNTEVYLIPAEGGVPKRLTFTATLERDDVADRMGPNNIVMGWKNDNQIVFRSKKTQFNEFKGKLLLASVEGGIPEELPLPRGGFCSFSPDQNKLAYNRIFREFRTWKRYRGGQADDIWIYDFQTKTTTNLTNNPAQDIIPMWSGNKIYFLSDRDENKRMNLYVYDLGTKKTRPLTHFSDFDIKFVAGNRAIVFENGGYVYRMDLSVSRTVPIFIHEDLVWKRGGLTDVSKGLAIMDFLDGSLALLGSRGEFFLPAKIRQYTGDKLFRNLTIPVVSRWQMDRLYLGRLEKKRFTLFRRMAVVCQPPTHNSDTYKFNFSGHPTAEDL
jgi:tricorn protease